jgi:hypothetical protein
MSDRNTWRKAGEWLAKWVTGEELVPGDEYPYIALRQKVVDLERSANGAGLDVEDLAMALFESHPDVAAIRKRMSADLFYDDFHARAWDLGADGEKNPAEGKARLWCFQEARRLVDRVRGRRDGLGWKAEPPAELPKRPILMARGFAGIVEAVEVKPRG